MKSYHYAKDQVQHGPLPEHELRAMLADGRLGADTPVWCDGMASWSPAGGVFGHANGGPPPLYAPPVSPPPTAVGDDFGMRMLLPVGRSGWAIAAGYLGLFSLVILPAPIALIVSIIAIRDLRKSASSPHPKHGMGRAIFGLVMGILGTCVLILALIGGIVS
jgi:GYF domain 2/Domain of unknown function (DUF4190)